MYNTSNNYKQIIYSDGTKHLLRVYADNVEIQSKYISSFKLLARCLANNEFVLGNVCARTVKLVIHKDAINLDFNEVRVTTGIAGEEIPLGIFRVIDKKQINDNSIELSLEDNMTKFDGPYDGSTISYPANLITVLRDICVKKGVELRFYLFYEYEQNGCGL